MKTVFKHFITTFICAGFIVGLQLAGDSVRGEDVALRQGSRPPLLAWWGRTQEDWRATGGSGG